MSWLGNSILSKSFSSYRGRKGEVLAYLDLIGATEVEATICLANGS